MKYQLRIQCKDMYGHLDEYVMDRESLQSCYERRAEMVYSGTDQKNITIEYVFSQDELQRIIKDTINEVLNRLEMKHE